MMFMEKTMVMEKHLMEHVQEIFIMNLIQILWFLVTIVQKLGEEPFFCLNGNICFSNYIQTFILRLHYSGDRNYLYLSKTGIWRFKALDNIPPYYFCFVNISEGFKND